MKKVGVVLLLVLVFLGGGISWFVWSNGGFATPGNLSPDVRAQGEALIVVPPPLAPRAPIAGLSIAEKNARIEKINRDYDEITGKISADYSAAGDKFPGGLSAFLRQLALLAREKHADLAAFLTPRELEDVELRDTPAGQAVQRQLGDTAATDEQRRAAFRLQKEFEDKFALTFDLSAAALLAREGERMATQAKIRSVLGDQLFGAWLRGEGGEYASAATFAQAEGLAASVPMDLWRVKNDFIQARLELRARTDLSAAQRRDAENALVTQVTTRVTGLIGANRIAKAGTDVLGWLPRAP